MNEKEGENICKMNNFRVSFPSFTISATQVEFKSYKEHHGTSNQQQMEAITELKLTAGDPRSELSSHRASRFRKMDGELSN